MIYRKKNIPLTHNRYEQEFEYMFVFSSGTPKTFNPIMRDNITPVKHNITGTHIQSDGSIKYLNGKRNKKSIVGNIFEYLVGGNKTTNDRKAIHPAMFPELLAYDHIISWSNEGDTVLDPMMGSGTVGKKCVELNRNFVGIELDKKYFEIAEKRINNREKFLNSLKDLK